MLINVNVSMLPLVPLLLSPLLLETVSSDVGQPKVEKP